MENGVAKTCRLLCPIFVPDMGTERAFSYTQAFLHSKLLSDVDLKGLALGSCNSC